MIKVPSRHTNVPTEFYITTHLMYTFSFLYHFVFFIPFSSFPSFLAGKCGENWDLEERRCNITTLRSSVTALGLKERTGSRRRNNRFSLASTGLGIEGDWDGGKEQADGREFVCVVRKARGKESKHRREKRNK